MQKNIPKSIPTNLIDLNSFAIQARGRVLPAKGSRNKRSEIRARYRLGTTQIDASIRKWHCACE